MSQHPDVQRAVHRGRHPGAAARMNPAQRAAAMDRGAETLSSAGRAWQAVTVTEREATSGSARNVAAQRSRAAAKTTAVRPAALWRARTIAQPPDAHASIKRRVRELARQARALNRQGI